MKRNIELSEKEIVTQLSEFYNDNSYAELRRIYMTKSFPEILSIDRREMSHSAFLAWLFNNEEAHGLGNFPIKQLLKILVLRDLQQNRKRHDKQYRRQTSTEKIASAILNENIQVREMKISLERQVNTGKQRGRLDILIDGEVNIFNVSGKPDNRKIHIIIENKIYSKEHNCQTQHYFNSKIKEFKKKDICLFVYLTTLTKNEVDSLSEPQCHSKEFIQINYQDLLDNILEPALEQPISSRSKFIIEEYIHCLSLPALSINNSNYNPSTIMATSKKITNMLNDFWNKHETFLTAVLNTLVNTTDDQDVKEKLKPALEAITVNKRRKKDKTHYEFAKKSANGKYALIYAVISEVLNRKKITLIDFSSNYKEAFNELKGKSKEEVYKMMENCLNNHDTEMTCPSYEELVEPNKIIDSPYQIVYNEKDYNDWWKKQDKTKEVYKKESDDLYIFNQWGYDSIDYFIYAYYKNQERWGMKENIIVKKENE